MTKIAVIGTGYVGLVSGLCFAKIGHDVICVDNNLDKIDQLENGEIPIFEPGLKEILDESVANKKITFTSDLAKAVQGCDAVFIAVGTPQDDKTGSADLSFVFEVAKQIACNINSYKVIVTKSTVPVGTNLRVKKIIQENNSKADFSVVSNPEFLREGSAIEDFLYPDRIVVGIEDEKAQKIMEEIYDYFSQKAPLIFTDITTAEMIKYAANSFLATKICFINEMADLCEKVGADVRKLSEGIGLDSRIGKKFLNPGPGFGGSCFPKDILALENIAEKNDVDLSLVSSTIESNSKRKLRMAQKIIAANGGDVSGKTIAILGLAFKGNTDDIRYSPALVIIEELIKNGAKIHAYDPEAIENTKKELADNPEIIYFQDSYQAINKADSTVIVTEWEEFRVLDLEKIKQYQKSNVLIDLRNMLDSKKVKEFGFEYFSIG
ncbi:MAG: UDPglucose 6-dehydrogenase [Rickettsiales bacterium]|jgi:UDPglucose 6-dehydrogenase